MKITLRFAALWFAAGWSMAVAAPRLIVHNAMVVTMERATPDPFRGYVIIGQDGKIAQLGAGDTDLSQPADHVIDAKGAVVMPGFVSAHSHLFQSAFRGFAADQQLGGWGQAALTAHRVHFMPGDLYAFTLHGALDYLGYGITTCYNYTLALGHPERVLAEEFRASIDSGQRFIFAYPLAVNATTSKETALAQFENFYEGVKAYQGHPLYLRLSLGTAGLQTTEENAFFFKTVADRYDLTMQIHYLQAPYSREAERALFPHLEKSGVLSSKFQFAHFIHTTDEILAATAAHGAVMVWNPLSNGRLASGLADIPKYLKMGIKVGMGVDGQASADVSDPFENMRVGLYATRMKYESAAIMQPRDILELQTIGSAEVVGVADRVGSLKEGKYGDLLIVRPKHFVQDVYASLVFACDNNDIESIIVGGDIVVNRGAFLYHDYRTITEDVTRRVALIRTKVISPVKAR